MNFYSKFIGDLNETIRGLKRKNSFLQNIAVVFSGNVLSFLLTFFATPIITRIYDPAAYGLFAIVNTIAANISMVAILGLPEAFVLPKKTRVFQSLVKITFVGVVAFTMISGFMVLLADEIIINYFKDDELENWLWVIPLCVMLYSMVAITGRWIIREKKFRENTIYGLIVNASSKTFVITFGVITGGYIGGIIFTEILSRALMVIGHTFLILRKSIYSLFFTRINRKQIISDFLMYKKYPLNILPGNFVNIFSAQIPIYILPIYGTQLLGNYALAVSLLDIPIRVIGEAISSVFFQKAAELKNHQATEQIKKLTLQTFYKLFFISFLPVCITVVYGNSILMFLLGGEQWKAAGEIAGILGFYYMFRLISSPISSIFNVYGKEKELFYYQIFMFITRILCLVVPVYVLKLKFLDSMIVYGAGNFLLYFVLTIYIFRICGIGFIKPILITCACIIVTLFVMFASRSIIFL
ncbi:oligosaccharide flippase family protein [Fulvivirgaceae bacterium BMA10]|uniref:Oligosaccharide flippase family protein n=1 Tax=Splendidivirga corallicola TaxID=3051826 RepID=A0ABT8L0G3_9BACT|nr:oligosaccharide flippase family protein [Fulvivirgaceae bacterium BMA10]